MKIYTGTGDRGKTSLFSGERISKADARIDAYGDLDELNSILGRVTEYLDQHLTPGTYDFYLCGRSEMIRDVTLLIDERFPGSLVYTELFY